MRSTSRDHVARPLLMSHSQVPSRAADSARRNHSLVSRGSRSDDAGGSPILHTLERQHGTPTGGARLPQFSADKRAFETTSGTVSPGLTRLKSKPVGERSTKIVSPGLNSPPRTRLASS